MQQMGLLVTCSVLCMVMVSVSGGGDGLWMRRLFEMVNGNQTSSSSRVNIQQTTIFIRELYERVGCTTPECQCLNATRVFSLLGANESTGLTQDMLVNAGPMLLYYMQDAQSSCDKDAAGVAPQDFTDWLLNGNEDESHEGSESDVMSHEDSQEEGHGEGHGGSHSEKHDEDDDDSFLSRIQKILKRLESHYTAKPLYGGTQVEMVGQDDENDIDQNNKCFDAYRLLEVARVEGEDVSPLQASHAASLTIFYMLEGKKIGEHCSALPYREELISNLLTTIGVHGHRVTVKDLETLLNMLGIGNRPSADHHDSHEEDSHEGNDHRRKRRAVTETSPLSKCLSASDLLDVYHVNATSGFSPRALEDLAPGILQQKVSSACAAAAPEEPTSKSKKRLSRDKVFGYGIISVFIISLGAFAGVILKTCAGYRYYREVMGGFLGLAVGSLIGDSVFHLLPTAFGVHGHHSAHGDQHHGDSVFVFEPYIIRGLGIVGAVYLFFVLESLMTIFKTTRVTQTSHGHSHQFDSVDSKAMEENGYNNQASPIESQTSHGHSHQFDSMDPKTMEENGYNNQASPIESEGTLSPVDVKQKENKSGGCCEKVKPIVLMILLGHGINNFADGLAIGAAFSQSLPGGLTTSFAIFCHEVPHELGDFAVLINAGLSIKMAALLNFLSALTAMLGLFVSASFATLDENFMLWIFTIAVGIFFYVALVEMVPELIRMQLKANTHSSRIRMFFLQSIGIIVGYAILFMIGLTEESFGRLF